MADHKATYKKIHWLKKEIATTKREQSDWEAQIPKIEEALAEATADNVEIWEESLKTVEAELPKVMAKVQQLEQDLAEAEATLPESDKPAAPKFDPEKHPLLKKTVEKSEPARPVVFSAGDVCEALWTDKQWYKAKIQTVLGSASDPKYRIKFLEYNETLTVGRDSIRPQHNEKKRKADAALNTPQQTPVVNSPHVISGPASINPEVVKAKKDGAIDTSVPVNRRAIGSNKALDRKANNWQAFRSKGKGKATQKESQFRSGTGVNSRVGFTGSGAGMTETAKRVRHSTKAKQDPDSHDGLPPDAGRHNSFDRWDARSRF